MEVRPCKDIVRVSHQIHCPPPALGLLLEHKGGVLGRVEKMHLALSRPARTACGRHVPTPALCIARSRTSMLVISFETRNAKKDATCTSSSSTKTGTPGEASVAAERA